MTFRRRVSGALWVACCAFPVSSGCAEQDLAPAPSAAVSGTPGAVTTALTRDDALPQGAVATSLQPSKGALREIIDSVPALPPPTSASGSLVGIDTGEEQRGGTVTQTEPDDSLVLLDLRTKLEPSNAGTERDLRATLYFDLVDRCRDAGGARLPPESVTVSFRVDARGHIDRSSVGAEAREAKFAKAAECMTRVVRTSDARFTPARLGQPIMVRAKVPSVD